MPPLPSARSIFLVLSDSLRLRTKAEVALDGAWSAADVPVEARGEAASPEAQGSGDGGEIPSLSSARAPAETAVGLDMEAAGGRVEPGEESAEDRGADGGAGVQGGGRRSDVGGARGGWVATATAGVTLAVGAGSSDRRRNRGVRDRRTGAASGSDGGGDGRGGDGGGSGVADGGSSGGANGGRDGSGGGGGGDDGTAATAGEDDLNSAEIGGRVGRGELGTAAPVESHKLSTGSICPSAPIAAGCGAVGTEGNNGGRESDGDVNKTGRPARAGCPYPSNRRSSAPSPTACCAEAAAASCESGGSDHPGRPSGSWDPNADGSRPQSRRLVQSPPVCDQATVSEELNARRTR